MHAPACAHVESVQKKPVISVAFLKDDIGLGAWTRDVSMKAKDR